MENRFQYNVATGRATLPLAIIFSLALFALCYKEPTDLISLGIAGAITYMLIEFNAIFAFIRTRTFLPSAMFVLFYAGCPALLQYRTDLYIPLLFMLMMFFLFQSFEKKDASLTVFHAFICLGTACMISPFFLYITPFMFIYMISLRSLSARTFFAGILGLVTPYAITASYYAYNDRLADMFNFIKPVIEHPVMANFHIIAFEDIIYFAIILLIGIVSSVMNAMYSFKDKVRSRIIIRTVILIELTHLPLIFIQPILFQPALVIQLILGAVMSGHLFALEFNKLTKIYLISILVLMLAGASLNVWIHLFNS